MFETIGIICTELYKIHNIVSIVFRYVNVAYNVLIFYL